MGPLYKFCRCCAVVLFCLLLIPHNLSAAENDLAKKSKDIAPQGLEDRTSWYLGKVEPVLMSATESESELDVIIYLYGSDTESQIEMIKERYEEEAIQNLSGQLQSAVRANRGNVSLSEQEEKMQVEQSLQQPLSAEQRQVAEELDSKLGEMRVDISEALKNTTTPVQDEISDFITVNGGRIVTRIHLTNSLGAIIPSSFLEELAGHERVRLIVRDAPKEYELDNSVPSVDYNVFWTNGFDGGVYDFGIPEGVQEDHPAFDSHTVTARSGSTAAEHGTHVTGIVASDDATYRGGAFGLDKILWAETGSGQSTTMSDMEWMAGLGDNPEAVNHSLGYDPAVTDYSANDAFYDAYVREYDIMVTKSAGNGGWGATATTMTYPATAYNVMTVANMDDQNTQDRSDDVRRWSSSTGPTVGNRKKPDITAPGTLILSANINWETGDDFISKSGTSMAAPHVAAAALLLADAGNVRPRSQKAVLINTADAWTSNDTESTSDDEQVSGSHWDKSYGWGYLDMTEAYFNRSDYFNDYVSARNDTAADNDYKLYFGTMFANEKATLVWEKRTTGYSSGAPPTTQYALTDIDLALYSESDGSLHDSDTDSNDNVHQVAVSSEIEAVIKVYAFSNTIEGATIEHYTIATEENFAKADPPEFTINLIHQATAGTGSQFTLTAQVTNDGDVASFNNNITLDLPSGFSIVSGNNPTSLGTIAAGATGQTNWSVRASSAPDEYSLGASNSSYSYDELYTGTGTSTITVGELPSPPSSISYPSSDTDGSFTVSWSSVSGATGYNLQRATNASFTDATTIYSGSSTTNSQHGLSDGTYFFRVRSVNGIGPSSWLSGDAVTVCSSPATPGSINYPSSDGDGSFTVSWPAASGATSYTLQRATNMTFTDSSTVYNGSSTTYGESGLGNGSYYYRVNGSNSCGTSNWRNGSMVSVCNQLPPPGSISYPANDTDGNFTVSWPAVGGATGYTLQRSTNSSFTSATTIYTGTSNTYTQSGLGSGTYYYRVRSNNGCGGGTWRAGGPITLCVIPAVPNQPNATDATFFTRVDISWGSVAGATSYQMYRCLDTSLGSCSLLTTEATSPYSDTSGERGTTYYYRIKSVNSCGESDFSNYDAGSKKRIVGFPSIMLLFFE